MISSLYNKTKKAIATGLGTALLTIGTYGCSLDNDIPIFTERATKILKPQARTPSDDELKYNISVTKTNNPQELENRIKKAVNNARKHEAKKSAHQHINLQLLTPTYSFQSPQVEYDFLGKTITREKYPKTLPELVTSLTEPDALFFSLTFSHPLLRESERTIKLLDKGLSLVAPYGGLKTFDDRADKGNLGLGQLAVPAIGLMYSFNRYDLSELPDFLESFLKKSTWNWSISYGKGVVKSERSGLIDFDTQIWRESLVASLGFNYFPKPEGFHIPNLFNKENPIYANLSIDTALDWYITTNADTIIELGLPGTPTLYETKMHSTARGLGFGVGASLYMEPMKELWFLPTDRDNVRFFWSAGYSYADFDARIAPFDLRGWKASIGIIYSPN
ncbi:MAG: hypothetical protein AABW46_01800 [Nanoarchaeota archaeon]